MNTPILECAQLTCERDDRVLFAGLSMVANAGDLIQVAGANGAGKTTLLRILAGLHGDYRGLVRWHWPDVDPRQHFLYLGHRAGLREELSALENLRWWCRLHNLALPDTTAAIGVALAQLGLRGYEDVPVRALSAGQKRRVMLSTLWLAQKSVWLLDEPFTALDSQGVTQLEQRLRQHSEAGGVVIYSSHHGLADGVRRITLGQPISEPLASMENG